MHYEWALSTCSVSESANGDGSIYKHCRELWYFQLHLLWYTQCWYTLKMRQQQNHIRDQCMHQWTLNGVHAVTVFKGELSLLLIIHETWYIRIWQQHQHQWSFTKRIKWEIQPTRGKWTTKLRESSERRIWGEGQSWLLGLNYLHLSVCCSYKTVMRNICLLLAVSK